MTNGNTGITQTYQAVACSSRINTSFSQQKSNLVATCTFLRLTSEVATRRRELEGAGERTIETLPSLVENVWTM